MPGTQMGPLVLIGISALFLGGVDLQKIEVIWVSGVNGGGCWHGFLHKFCFTWDLKI